MPSILFDTLSFCLTLGCLFFLPGWVVLRPLRQVLLCTAFESALFAFATSLGLLDLLLLVFNRFGVSITAVSVLVGITASVLLCQSGYWIFRRIKPAQNKTMGTALPVQPGLLPLSRTGLLFFTLIIIATFFIRGLYFERTSAPTATDLGHHLYWAKTIVVSGHLPEYAKIDVVTDESGRSSISPPQPIADFIIGEHLPFAALALVSRLDFLSAFPLVWLALVNLFGVAACAYLGWRSVLTWQGDSLLAEWVFLAIWLFLGPLSALASPQAKFVSGGVVGNVLGNFFIPLILLCFYRALRERQSLFLGLGLFFSWTLAYTHHLSLLMLLFILTTTLFLLVAVQWRNLIPTLRDWLALTLHPLVLSVLLVALFCLAFVATPSYLHPSVIDTALGTPTKTTRTGLSFAQVEETVGLVKFAFALLGFFVLIRLYRHAPLAAAFLGAWSGILLIMTLFPHWLWLDLPSGRIGDFLIYPFALLSALGLVWIGRSLSLNTSPARHMLLTLLLGLVLSHGLLEDSQALPAVSNKAALMQETIAVSRYLSESSAADSIILKDHNYLTGDAWMKLFFVRDYGFPLSRGFFKRYEEGGRRQERCTLLMISSPHSQAGERCYRETGTRFVVVNPEFDATQFNQSNQFARVYSSPHVAVFARRDAPIQP